jgi:hypothetical protein
MVRAMAKDTGQINLVNFPKRVSDCDISALRQLLQEQAEFSSQGHSRIELLAEAEILRIIDE